MPDKLKLSIIIPHFNCPDKLERLLASIPDSEEIEVIVCDDCSTKELDKLSEIAAKYPSCIWPEAKNNTGAGGARNRGLEVARGEWILFADSDDYFTEEMHRAVKSCYDSEADIILFRPTSVIEGTDEIADRHQTSEGIVQDLVRAGFTTEGKSVLNGPDETAKLAELKARFMMVLDLSRMIKRSLIEGNHIRFDEKMRYFEDAIFAMTCGRAAGKIGASDTVIYVITKDVGTETYSKDYEANRLRLKCSYIRAKKLRKSLTLEQRKLLHADYKLVLMRLYGLVRFHVKKTLYPAYSLLKKLKGSKS